LSWSNGINVPIDSVCEHSVSIINPILIRANILVPMKEVGRIVLGLDCDESIIVRDVAGS
jgi:hypothetical protein